MHVLVVRLFVESILRYGLPPHFQAAVVRPGEKSEGRLRAELDNTFGGGGGGGRGAGAGQRYWLGKRRMQLLRAGLRANQLRAWAGVVCTHQEEWEREYDNAVCIKGLLNGLHGEVPEASGCAHSPSVL